MNNSSFEPGDVYYNLNDLVLMLSAIRELISDMSFEHPDGTRNGALDRACAMMRVAEREARRQHEAAAIFDRAGEWVPHHREAN